MADANREVRNLKDTEFEYGKRPDGNQIGKYSGGFYSLKKYKLNPLAGSGNVDLKLTGASERGEFIRQEAGGFVIDTNTPQWGYNIIRYGKDIRSVNQSDFEAIQAKRDAPILVRYINEQLQIR